MRGCRNRNFSTWELLRRRNEMMGQWKRRTVSSPTSSLPRELS